MEGLRRELLPPSGVEYATSLNLIPNTTLRGDGSSKKVFRNLVVARSSYLRIYEIREEPAPLPTVENVGSSGRKGTEAVEGEVEMDHQGEGFVNVGVVKSAAYNQNVVQSTVTRLYLVRAHRMHGVVIGLDRVKTLATAVDGLDRLVVAFKDAKIAILEWSDNVYGLITLSIHTYERALQVIANNTLSHRALLRMDPDSRCAVLSLPRDTLAILPFYQSLVDLDVGEQDQVLGRDVPYSPSFIIDLTEIDEKIHNIIDLTFLPGFNNPTIAILCEYQQTWTGRLKEFRDTTSLFVVTLDLNTRLYPIIFQVHNLPYDCLTVYPCPSSYGGILLVAADSILHVEHTGRVTAVPANGWASRTTDTKMIDDDSWPNRDLSLEGSRILFIDDRNLLLFTVQGLVYPVEIEVEGRVVLNIVISPEIARCTIPSVVIDVGFDQILVGSTVGPSTILKMLRILEELKDTATAKVADTEKVDAEMDLDDDIYGEKILKPSDTQKKTANGHVETRTVLRLAHRDSLREYGPISDMVFGLARNGDRYVPELVACTGTDYLGGFTLFQRDLPTRLKRKVHAIGGSRGVWSLFVRPGSKSGALHSGRSGIHDDDSIIVSTDATPSPGLSRMASASRSPKSDPVIFGRVTVTTIGAASFFQRTAILQVTTNALRVLETDGTERQVIKDMDGSQTRPKIRACSISDPFILILREDDTLGLFVGEADRGKIRRKDMSAMGEKSSRYLAASFCSDQTNLLKLGFNPNVAQNKSKGKGQTTTLEAATDSSRGSQWLLLCRPQGVLEIWSLPKLSLAFSATFTAPLQSVLMDSLDPVGKSVPEDPPRKSDPFDIDQIIIAPLGETDPTLHLLIYLRCAQLAIYKIHPTTTPSEFPSHRESSLLIQFTKFLSKSLDSFDEAEQGQGTSHETNKRIQRRLIPFKTQTQPSHSLSGVFFTGDRPHWIICTNRGGVRLFPSGHPVVHAFTTCSLWGSKGDFLLYTDEGPCLIEWMPDLCLDSPIPLRSVPRGRPYTSITHDPSTGLVVAASSLKSKFVLFDDDGNPVWVPDAANISEPKMECSTIELISPEDWTTLDGYEFPSNEFVTAIECVELETLSTSTGLKEYIAVATTIFRGEDLAVKGAAYIFEIIEVVPDPVSRRQHRLRLLCRDDAKGAVTTICGINGYLVSSMGQKVFVRAFELDERLVGVAFLDVGVYVTSLKTMKNMLLIGDAIKGVWLVAFQEDPFKLAVLAKYGHQTCISQVDFFFRDDQLSIIVGDEDGVIRLLSYDPLNVESQGGQNLILNTEFNGQCEYRTSITTISRSKSDLPFSRLFMASTDGSLHVLIPVEEAVYKRLQLLQGQLTRNVQHIAGLNPRAFRLVRNEYTSRPLTKGILDDGLLDMFDDLPVSKQVEMTRQIASEKSIIVKDLITNAGSW